MNHKLLAIMSLIILIILNIAMADNLFPIYIRNRPSNSIIELKINYTTDRACSDVLFSDSQNVVIDNKGVGFMLSNITALTTTPSFICEYQDNVLTAVHQWNDRWLVGNEIIFNDVIIDNNNDNTLNIDGDINIHSNTFKGNTLNITNGIKFNDSAITFLGVFPDPDYVYIENDYSSIWFGIESDPFLYLNYNADNDIRIGYQANVDLLLYSDYSDTYYATIGVNSKNQLFFSNAINAINPYIRINDNTNISGNVIADNYFYQNGNSINDTGDSRWVNVNGDIMTGDLSIKDSDGEFHNISRDLQISDEMNRNITLSGLNGTLASDGNLTITTITGENIAVNIDKSETILNKNTDSIIITSGTNESPILNQIIYTNAANPVLTKRTTLGLKAPSVAAFLQGANFTYVSAIGLATIDNLVGGLFNRFFRDGSTYRSGFDLNVSTNMVNISTGVISFLFSEVEIIQNHSTSDLYVHNHVDGSFHQHITLDEIQTYMDGSAISNNKYFNSVFCMAITHDGAGVMYVVTQDKPLTEYTKSIDAEIDGENTINFFPPDDIVSLACVPVVRVVIRRSGGVNTIQTLSKTGLLYDDLRGTVTKTSASPPPSGITAHSDLTNLDFASALHTGFASTEHLDNDTILRINGTTPLLNITKNLTIGEANIGYNANETSFANFDGSGYFDIGEGSSLNINGTEITLSAWFRTNDNHGGLGHIVSKWLSPQESFRIVMSVGNMFFQLKNASDGIFCSVNGGGNYSNGEWQHVVGIYNSSVCAIFINGTQLNVSIGLFDTIRSQPTANVLIGAANEAVPERFWKGDIDEVMIFNQSLNTQEIEALFALGQNFGTYTGAESENLVAHYQMRGSAEDNAGDNDGIIFPTVTFFYTPLGFIFYNSVFFKEKVIFEEDVEFLKGAKFFGNVEVVNLSVTGDIVGNVNIDGTLTATNLVITNNADIVNDLTGGTVRSDDGAGGSCVDAHYVGGIFDDCND